MVYPFIQNRLYLFLIVLGLSCSSAFAHSASKLVQPGRSYPTFVLQLAPVTAGDSEVSAGVTCDASLEECLTLVSKASLCISGRLESTCAVRAFAPAPGQNDHWQLKFSGEPLHTGEAVWLVYGNGQRSNIVHAFPSASDVAVTADCTRMTVSVYFPGQAQMELRLINGGALKRAPWKSATAADDTATFNTDTSFADGDQLEAIASIGDERRMYKPVAAACGAEAAVPADAKTVKTPPANTQPDNQPAPPATPPANPVLYSSKEGDLTIKGFAEGFQKVEPRVMEGSSTIVIADTPVDGTSGQFAYPLALPLEFGETITATGKVDDKAMLVANKPKVTSPVQKAPKKKAAALGGNLVTASFSKSSAAGNDHAEVLPPVEGTAVAPTPSTTEVAPLDLDWGRVRGYFTLGLVLSQSSNDFSVNNASPFIDFNLDKSWLARDMGRVNGDANQSWSRMRVNTFFDARLTSIATSAVSTPSTGSSATSSTPQTITPSSVLLSRQAASLQIGAYLPLVMSRYNYDGRDYSLFVAPLGKTGFYTPTNSNAVSNSTNTATASPTTPTRFYDFYGYGVRIGHSQDYRDPGMGPELLSYLDILVGKYGNFEYTNSDCITGGAGCFNQRLWRYSFEGMLKIPHTPLIFGMSANLAAQRSHLKGELAPQDDLRFLFGAKFDAQKIVKSLFSTGI